MRMDEGEIIREYNAEKNKMRQVGILADLNAVTKKEMAYWLRDHGQDVAGQFFQLKKKSKAPEETVVEFEEAIAVPEAGEITAVQEAGEIAIAAMPEPEAPGCVLTEGEAYAVAELIDTSLFDIIRNMNDMNDMQELKSIVYAYDKLSKYSGYKGMTE